MGAWFEAKIVKITKKSSITPQVSQSQSVEQEDEKPSAVSPEQVTAPVDQEQVVTESVNNVGNVECNEDDGYVYSIIFERFAVVYAVFMINRMELILLLSCRLILVL